MAPTRRDVMRAAMVGAVAAAAPIPGSTAVFAATTAVAPGGPGGRGSYAPANKMGFGTARALGSTAWFTLQRHRMTEVYYPDLSTPASRETQLVVTDGAGLVESSMDVDTVIECPDPRVPLYRHICRGTGWSATLTYVTDPARDTVLLDVEVRADRALRFYLHHDPQLSSDGKDDRVRPWGDALVARDGRSASALAATGGFLESAVGYVGINDGLTQLRASGGTLTHRYSEAGPGNVAQLARLRLDGRGNRRVTVALGFGATPSDAHAAAAGSLAAGFEAARTAYTRQWLNYHASLTPMPAAVPAGTAADVYAASVTMLAACEDKRHRGAFVASPSMPWAWGFDPELAAEFGPYHLMWPRDQYHVATGLLAAGDRDAAHRALSYVCTVQQADGHYPQNCTVSGEEFWTSIQLDEQTLPMVLAWVLDRTDATTLDSLVRAGDFVLGFHIEGHAAPFSQQERWENQSGYSPSTIAACVAGFVCLADLLERAGRADEGARFLQAADRWRARTDAWTLCTSGPLADQPYYVRVTKDGDPNAATTYDLGDNHPRPVDQRTIVDAGFLELARLGVRRPADPAITSSLSVVDREISTLTPHGRIWHRFSHDGYGEQRDGGPWNLEREGLELQLPTYGRLWPLLTGERGEHDVLLGRTGRAAGRIRTMAECAHPTGLLPEQVWDEHPPHRPMGTPNASATPLVWTHAGYLRLVWAVEHGHLVAFPSVVAQRYLR